MGDIDWDEGEESSPVKYLSETTQLYSFKERKYTIT